MRLAGKIALVTGASRGIGRVVARALAAEGCALLVHARTTANLEPLVKELTALGCRVAPYCADLDESAQVEALCRRIAAEWGSPDIIVNNAAWMSPWQATWHKVPVADFERSFRVNTLAPMIITGHFVPAMVTKGWGRIVNLTTGMKAQPELMPYAASKAALDKWVADAAPGLAGTGVSLSLLDPGWLKTDMGGTNAPGEVDSVLPGALVALFDPEGMHGKLVRAQDYAASGGT